MPYLSQNNDHLKLLASHKAKLPFIQSLADAWNLWSQNIPLDFNI